jgi:hypothetical protein
MRLREQLAVGKNLMAGAPIEVNVGRLPQVASDLAALLHDSSYPE